MQIGVSEMFNHLAVEVRGLKTSTSLNIGISFTSNSHQLHLKFYLIHELFLQLKSLHKDLTTTGKFRYKSEFNFGLKTKIQFSGNYFLNHFEAKERIFPEHFWGLVNEICALCSCM